VLTALGGLLAFHSAGAVINPSTWAVLKLDIFIEPLGLPMTLATFATWVVVLAVMAIAVSIAFHEYHVWRRKRLPKLFGQPRPQRAGPERSEGSS